MGNFLESLNEKETFEAIYEDLQRMEFPTIPQALSTVNKRINEALEYPKQELDILDSKEDSQVMESTK